MKKQKTVCFVAGRSGGHIIPALTLAQQIKEKNNNARVLFFSTSSKIDKKILKNNSVIDKHIELSLQNIPYKKPLKYPVFLAKAFYTTIKSFIALIKHRPTKVVSMGGYVSLPVCVSAFLLRIPIELFELNAVPGKAITTLAPLSTKIHVCFKQAMSHLPKQKCQISQYPVRYLQKELLQAEQSTYKAHNLSLDKYTILILGGSQGSISINNAIKQFITTSTNLRKKIQIIHQTGTLDKTDWNAFYKENNVNAFFFAFKSDLQDCYKLADMVICRSGAGTLFETMFFNKKCITIPLEAKTTSHQVDNAKALEKMHPNLVAIISEKGLKHNTSLLKNEINKHIEALSKES